MMILGDMLELGHFALEMHHEAGRRAVEAGCRLVMALGEMAPQVAAGARGAGLSADKALAFDDLGELVKAARRLLGGKDVVLVKGSRAMAMERVVEALRVPAGEAD